DHPRAGDHLLARNAHAHCAGGLVRNAAIHAHRVLLDAGFRNATGHAHFALLFANLGAAGLDLDDGRDHFAHAAAAGDRALLLHHARNPALPGNAIVRRAGIAARIVADRTEVVAEGFPVRILFTAFPVAAIDALGDHLGLGDGLVAGL